jgi:hypothetical protein
MSDLFKDKDYNKPLRAHVLICSVREEEAASEAIKSLLRLVKPESKTLDNKSSSLSFKNKIDLLYDIDDLNKEEYTSLIKFMEIRNQFIHNPNCNSFQDLEKEAPELPKYLSTQFKNETEDKEKSYLESFRELFMRTLGKLLVLNLEYRKGFTNEMIRYIDAKALENFDSILATANELWKEQKEKYPIPAFPMFPHFHNSEQDVKDFEAYLKIAVGREKIKVTETIINKEVTEKDVFQRRANLLEDFKKEQAELEQKKSS